MLRSSFFGLWALAAAAIAGWSAGAAANTVTINNSGSTQTLAESYSLGCSSSGGCPSNSFFSGSSYWGANVGGAPQIPGGEYTTSGVTASYSAGNGTTSFGTVTLTFDTLFAETCATTCGVDQLNSQYSVYAGDIFIKSNAAGNGLPTSTQTFNFAIALGYTSTSDGGLSKGLYAGSYGNGSSSDKTSTQVWGNSNLSGWYGGAFASAQDCSGTPTTCNASGVVQSPTVVTGTTDAGGTAEAGVSVGEAWNYSPSNPSADTLTVTLNATTLAGGSLLTSIFSDFDLFWGTGDCSNAPIWGNIASLTSVPEPSSLALFLSAAIGIVLIRRRKRISSTVA